jgi:DNA invertase Pin-like site-specific DNA recombinase
MTTELPEAGAAGPEQRRQAAAEWLKAAFAAGIDTASFPTNGSLTERVAWAKAQELEVGSVLSRYSSKLGHSTSAQIAECMQGAATRRIYVPPEYICVDEGVTGRKSRRDGLERATLILQAKLVGVILVYKVSRLFRVAYKGFAFVQEEVVDEGMRAISVSQAIDTKDEKTWKMLMYLHGMSDEMLLGTIADHVRSGQVQLFAQGYTIGALPVGYRRVEVPGAPPTNQGRARTMPAVDPQQAPLILAAFQDVASGMPLRRAWKKYRAGGGASDPRAKGRPMSYHAFRRLLANRRYTGVWEFGRKRNVWSNKRDGVRQVEQPDTQVATLRSDELRIVDDATFEAVQAILARRERGSRAPKGTKDQLCLADLVTELFVCRKCRERFYQAGSDGRWMRCKNGDLCPQSGIVRRGDALRAVCLKLAELIQRDSGLLLDVVRRSTAAEQDGDGQLTAQLAQVNRQIAQQNAKIGDLADLAGQGSEEDRATLKAKIRAAQAELARLIAERSRLEHLLASRCRLTPDEAQCILVEMGELLTAAADGRLGEPAVYRVLGVVKALTGGQVAVEFEARAGRKQTVVRGTFMLNLLAGVCTAAHAATDAQLQATMVELWLRPPPRMDQLAERVHQLIDVEQRSYRDAAKILRGEGHNVNSGNVWQMLRRYYEMRGLPSPDRPYNNGHPRGDE